MRIYRNKAAQRILATGAAAVIMTATMGSPAMAVDDSFAVSTTNGCGVVNFIDYGPGWPGDGNNDDYLVIHDYCADGYGVKVWIWLTRRTTAGSLTFSWERYNGNGLAGEAVLADPWQDQGDVVTNDRIGLKVCLVDGFSDPNPKSCDSRNHTSSDG
jgi:hypothetical protein